jgi:exodeoxyribonuclease-3
MMGPRALPNNGSIWMRIATYNVNDINGRLGNLLGWLEEAHARHRLSLGAEGARPEVSGGRDPRRRLRRDLAWTEELERSCDPRARRGANGDPPRFPRRSDDTHSRYIEAAIHGMIVGC